MKQEYYKLCDKRFDKAFKEVEGLARYPWVGCLYAERSPLWNFPDWLFRLLRLRPLCLSQACLKPTTAQAESLL